MANRRCRALHIRVREADRDPLLNQCLLSQYSVGIPSTSLYSTYPDAKGEKATVVQVVFCSASEYAHIVQVLRHQVSLLQWLAGNPAKWNIPNGVPYARRNVSMTLRPERVNDFAAPGVMNLLRRVLASSGWRSPRVVG